MPSQQSSLSGTRTALTPHDAIPFVSELFKDPQPNPWPKTQASSVPVASTPSTRTGCPDALISSFPLTRTVGTNEAVDAVSVAARVVSTDPKLTVAASTPRVTTKRAIRRD